MGKCGLGECLVSKNELHICCLDCESLESCLEKSYTCIQVLRIRTKVAVDCDEYIKIQKERGVNYV